MGECIGTVYCLDGRLENCDGFSLHYQEGPGSVYEVIRVMDGIPLFLEDHLGRLEESTRITKTVVPCSLPLIRRSIIRLIEANRLRNGNVKVVCQHGETGRQLFVYITPHQYPGPEQYKNGIPVALFRGARELPNAKQINPGLRNEVNRIREAEGVHEVLLVDQHSCITEGSRSNVFFIRDGVVLTPPVCDVLPGITRKHVIECCQTRGIPFREEKIPSDALPGMEAAFLSGTSRRVLPVNRIDHQKFDAGHPLLREIQHAFNNLVTVYLLSAKLAEMD